MNSVSVRDLSVRAGGKKILDTITFEVQSRDFFVIIGPNGAGKTTLLKALCGLTDNIEGRIRILDRDRKEYSRRKMAATVALVPQQMNQDFAFTVEETVLMGRSPHLGLLEQEKKKDFEISARAMAFTRVEHLAGRRINELSGGEMQRVMIARALCQQPRIILLDEPTAALDPAHQLMILQLMQRLRQEEEMTVLMVSHDLNLASLFASRILLLKEGRVILSGTPEEIMTPDNLEQAYGCRMHIDKHPSTGRPRISLIP